MCAEQQQSASYKTAMVTHLDILGFSRLIQESRTDVAAVGRIVSVLRTVKEQTASGGRIHRNEAGDKEKIFYAFNFSDLTVRCTVVPDGVDLGDYINWEILYVGAIQLDLLRNNVLLRGGISLGQIFVEDRDLLFGPALVKAYKLESEYAIYPRVVIDRDFLNEIDNRPGSRYWRDHVRRGDDGAFFVDYLFGTVLDNYATPETEPFLELLGGHRDAIVAAIADDIESKDERVRQKYMWLALYHNSTVERLAERISQIRLNAAKFMIDDRFLKF
jgi:hypothetical protein